MDSEPMSGQGDALRVIGLMSGTSVDAVDAALTEITGSGSTLQVRLLAFHSVPVPRLLRDRVLAACTPGAGTTKLVCELNAQVGELFARSALELVAVAGGPPVDIIGSHGQTVWHQGEGGADAIPSTLQVGDPCYIAERTGVTTVGDFRQRDMAAGGKGAPLVSYADWALYRSAVAGRALQNIGGIANVTVLPASGRPEDVFAFDTGPGNMLIDAVVQLATDGRQAYDRRGALARSGTSDPDLLHRILSQPFFLIEPPRTTGREEFGTVFAQSLWKEGTARGLTAGDIAATCTQATARSIADAYRRWILPRIALEAAYLSGGGTRNPALLDALRAELPEVPIRLLASLGGDPQAKEALAFAVLAAETLHHVPTSLRGATGARHGSVLGKIVPGANWPRLQRRLAAEQSTATDPDKSPPAGTHRGPPPARTDTPAGAVSAVPAASSPGAPRKDGRRRHSQTNAPLTVAVGVDGGGTKTLAVAVTRSGDVVATAQARSSNLKAVGSVAALTALDKVLTDLAASLPPATAVQAVHAALAGAGRPEDAAFVRQHLLGRFRSAPLAAAYGALEASAVTVSNDALAALAAAETTIGIVIIAGTGSLVWGRNAAGETARAGGWGYLLGDEGSGYALGRAALTAVLAAHDGRGPATALTTAVLAHLHLDGPPDLVTRIYESSRGRDDIASLAPLVLARAAARDPVAVAIVAQAAADLADQARAVAERLHLIGEPFPVVCSGGLFASTVVRSSLSAALETLVGGTCVWPRRSPAEGAALLAWDARALAEDASPGA